MRILFPFLFLIALISSAQDVYRHHQDTALSLGAINTDTDQLKTLINGNIAYLDRSELTKTDQLSSAAYLQQIHAAGLMFRGGGSEPFWSVELNDQTLSLSLNETEIHAPEIIVNFSHHHHDFLFTFITTDGSLYGVVRRSLDDYCSLAITEEQEMFEIILSTKTGVYQGCLSVGPPAAEHTEK